MQENLCCKFPWGFLCFSVLFQIPSKCKQPILRKKRDSLKIPYLFPTVIRFCELKRDLNALKEGQRRIENLLAKQTDTLEDVQGKAGVRKTRGIRWNSPTRSLYLGSRYRPRQ